jgi:hypothetical protein
MAISKINLTLPLNINLKKLQKTITIISIAIAKINKNFNVEKLILKLHHSKIDF